MATENHEADVRQWLQRFVYPGSCTTTLAVRIRVLTV
jgi:hypothetical protein